MEPASAAREAGPIAPRRARFPLWLKLALSIGFLMALLIALSEWRGFAQDLGREERASREALVGLAGTVASAIDGDLHATYLTDEAADSPSFQALHRWLDSVVAINKLRYASTLAMDERRRFTYVVDASQSPMPLGFPIFDVTEAHLRAAQGEPAYLPDMEDEWGRYQVAFAPIRNRSGQVVGVLELDADAEAADLLLAVRLRRTAVEVAVAIALGFGLAMVFARYLNRHLRALTRAALRVADGDLRDEVVPKTHDELALLGSAFNRMLAGLRDRELLRETFGRFVTAEVAARILADPSRVRLGGEQRRVTILMSDLRGFTALAEELGPEATVELLNRYLSCMCDVIMKRHGTIGEFIGDGILVLFGAPESSDDDAHRALACAVEMQLALERFNRAEGHALDMGIGVHTGTVIAGNVGSDKRMKYGVVGDAVNLAARIESATVGCQVLISEATRAFVGDTAEVGPGFELRAKGRREPLRCQPLLGLGPPYDLKMPRGSTTDELVVGLAARCFPVRDKQVASGGHDARITHASASGLRLVTDWHAEPRDDCKLALTLDDGSQLDHLYGKVSAVVPAPHEAEDARVELQVRLSPLLPDERAAYDQMLARSAAGTTTRR